eukprot:2408132-Amphidinium_carterae.1
MLELQQLTPMPKISAKHRFQCGDASTTKLERQHAAKIDAVESVLPVLIIAPWASHSIGG